MNKTFLITKNMRINTKFLKFKIKEIIVDKCSVVVADIGDNKVVKIGYKTNNIRSFFNCLKYIKNNTNPITVKIFDYGLIGKDKYYYVMERLKPISNKHIEKFDQIGYRKFVTNQDISFDRKRFPKESSFLKNFYQYKYYQSDPNYGNIMVNKYGSYKLIDLETFKSFNSILNY